VALPHYRLYEQCLYVLKTKPLQRAFNDPLPQMQVNELGTEILVQRPVTILLFLFELATFVVPGGLPLKDLCLSPFCVWEKGQWMRYVAALCALCVCVCPNRE
jgi:hypothetical protein